MTSKERKLVTLERPHKLSNSETLIQHNTKAGRYRSKIKGVCESCEGNLTIFWDATHVEDGYQSTFITPIDIRKKGDREFLEALIDCAHPHSKRIREKMTFELGIEVNSKKENVYVIDVMYLPPNEFKYKN